MTFRVHPAGALNVRVTFVAFSATLKVCSFSERWNAFSQLTRPVSASADTPRIVAKIRKDYPDFPIIATGGPTEESIRKTIEAGANAITWTPPSVSELFKGVMNKYRDDINNVGHH